MTRRASLPGADELFRKTDQDPKPVPEPQHAQEAAHAVPAPVQVPAPQPPVQTAPPAPAAPSPDLAPAPVLSTSSQIHMESHRPPAGRTPRHDEKVTFYCTADELTRLERARLTLRADYKMASDRGRIIRTALAVVLEELETLGPDSALARRLSEF